MFIRIDKELPYIVKSNLVDLIHGSINRICVTDDLQEIAVMLGSINFNLSRLTQSRILELTKGGEKRED